MRLHERRRRELPNEIHSQAVQEHKNQMLDIANELNQVTYGFASIQVLYAANRCGCADKMDQVWPVVGQANQLSICEEALQSLVHQSAARSSTPLPKRRQF